MQARSDVSPARNGLVARCHWCRNRCGLATLIVLDSGVLCCRRCWQNGALLDTPTPRETAEMLR